MSKVEMKVIYDNEINPITNILQFNYQIVFFLEGMLEYRQNKLENMSKDAQDMQNISTKQMMYSIGEVELLSKYRKWLVVMQLVISSANVKKMITLDAFLDTLAKNIIAEDEKKETQN